MIIFDLGTGLLPDPPLSGATAAGPFSRWRRPIRWSTATIGLSTEALRTLLPSTIRSQPTSPAPITPASAPKLAVTIRGTRWKDIVVAIASTSCGTNRSAAPESPPPITISSGPSSVT